jgi:hypothetical protein
MIAHGQADDRGVYRFFGLEPGSYLVRTVGKDYPEGSYLPTFSEQGHTVDGARAVPVFLDRDTTDVNVRPAPGNLLLLTGLVSGHPRNRNVTVTLISDMNRQSLTTSSVFTFRSLPPGPYEIVAESAGDERSPAFAAYASIPLDRDRTDLRLHLMPMPGVDFAFVNTEGQPVDPPGLRVMARHKDLAEYGNPVALRIANGRTSLAPGRWDLWLAPMNDSYVVDFSGPGAGRARPDGWNEITLPGGPAAVKFVLASDPGAVHGVVSVGGAPIVGAPVFLEAWDPETHRRAAELRTTRTDARGQYHFTGIAPGPYRILSSFEFEDPDPSALTAARVIQIEKARDLPLDLDLYVLN